MTTTQQHSNPTRAQELDGEMDAECVFSYERRYARMYALANELEDELRAAQGQNIELALTHSHEYLECVAKLQAAGAVGQESERG